MDVQMNPLLKNKPGFDVLLPRPLTAGVLIIWWPRMMLQIVHCIVHGKKRDSYRTIRLQFLFSLLQQCTSGA